MIVNWVSPRTCPDAAIGTAFDHRSSMPQHRTFYLAGAARVRSSTAG